MSVHLYNNYFTEVFFLNVRTVDGGKGANEEGAIKKKNISKQCLTIFFSYQHFLDRPFEKKTTTFIS